jgi:lactate permease
MVSWKETKEVLPAIAVCSVSFAGTQFFWGNYVDPGLVDIVAGAVCLVSTTLFLKMWKPKRLYQFEGEAGTVTKNLSYTTGQTIYGWTPFLILGVFVLVWGMPSTKTFLNAQSVGPLKTQYLVPVPALDKRIVRVPPVVPEPTTEAAVYTFNWVTASGTGVMIAAGLAALVARFSFARFFASFKKTCSRMVIPLLAITPMLGLAYVTRYSGLDAVLGLAFTHTGFMYPFFAAFLGWLGVALTGSDTSSNALFGSLQRITAEQLNLDPVLICSANSTGGVMGKMVDAQSIVVAATATNQINQEGLIFRFVFWHSIALTAMVALIVFLYAYVFQSAVPHNVQFLDIF